VEAGSEVGLFYDPMLAKLIVWGASREQAVERMHRALLELTVDGIETSREFHLRVMEDSEFRAGAIDIQWLERRLPSLLGAAPSESELRAAAIAAALIADSERNGRMAGNGAGDSPSVAAKNVSPASAAMSSWAQLARAEALRGG
jgi:acetyl-CoA carboxylase biotin carboxylase subunit